jgi:hypothetical protein
MDGALLMPARKGGWTSGGCGWRRRVAGLLDREMVWHVPLVSGLFAAAA